MQSLKCHQLKRCNTMVIALRQMGQPLPFPATVFAHDVQKREWSHGTRATPERGTNTQTSLSYFGPSFSGLPISCLNIVIRHFQVRQFHVWTLGVIFRPVNFMYEHLYYFGPSFSGPPISCLNAWSVIFRSANFRSSIFSVTECKI